MLALSQKLTALQKRSQTSETQLAQKEKQWESMHKHLEDELKEKTTAL